MLQIVEYLAKHPRRLCRSCFVPWVDAQLTQQGAFWRPLSRPAIVGSVQLVALFLSWALYWRLDTTVAGLGNGIHQDWVGEVAQQRLANGDRARLAAWT